MVASPYPLGIDWSAYNRIPRLYFTEFTGSKLWRVNPDGSELVLEATFPKPPYAIDVHPFLGTYHIGGTGAPAGLGVYEGVVGNSQRNLLSSDGGRIDGLVTVPELQRVYFSDGNGISFYDFIWNSTQVLLNYTQSGNGADGLDFHRAGQKLYWVHGTSVRRCNPDGSQVETFAGSGGAGFFIGVAIDQDNNLLYAALANPSIPTPRVSDGKILAYNLALSVGQTPSVFCDEAAWVSGTKSIANCFNSLL